MAKRGDKRERRSLVLEPDAAGIDIGAEEIYVAVPPDRDGGIDAPVQQLHLRPACTCRLARPVPDPDRGDGVDRGVLDPAVSNTGGARVQGLFGQRTI